MEVRISGEFSQPSFLQLGVIIGIEVVECDDSAAVGQETSCDVKADEASRPSDENRFASRLTFLRSVRLGGEDCVRPERSPKFGDRADHMVKTGRRSGLNDEPAVSSEVFVP